MTMLQRVLHVEDDPSIRMVTSVALEKVGNLEVLSCEGGEQAMAKPWLSIRRYCCST